LDFSVTDAILNQFPFAHHLKSSQSRIAKMAAGDASVSLDLIVKSLLALGALHKDLAQMIGGLLLRSAR
jgi:hypothetical protein